MGDGFCRHERRRPWVEMPLDVKTGSKTRFGKLVWCDDCDLGMVAEMPTVEEVAGHYRLDAYYTQGASHLPEVQPGLMDRVLVKLAWLVDQGSDLSAEVLRRQVPQGGRAIDIGCGRGDLARILVSMGFDVTGVEPDPVARANATAAGLAVHDGTAEDLPLALQGQRFDLVTMTHVLEHCRSPEKALLNAAGLLADDGVLYCEVPNFGCSYLRTYALIAESLDVPRHLHFFTRASLERMCCAAGLSVAGAHFNGYTRHFEAGWRSWENGIADRLANLGHVGRIPRRSLARDLWLWAQSAAQRPEAKYDCLGLFLRKAQIRHER